MILGTKTIPDEIKVDDTQALNIALWHLNNAADWLKKLCIDLNEYLDVDRLINKP